MNHENLLLGVRNKWTLWSPANRIIFEYCIYKFDFQGSSILSKKSILHIDFGQFQDIFRTFKRSWETTSDSHRFKRGSATSLKNDDITTAARYLIIYHIYYTYRKLYMLNYCSDGFSFVLFTLMHILTFPWCPRNQHACVRSWEYAFVLKGGWREFLINFTAFPVSPQLTTYRQTFGR